jgi:hypothetical protein
MSREIQVTTERETEIEIPEAAAMRRWLLLAVGSLILAGLLALSLVIARAPVFSTLVTDPAFFRRCLVVHVDLSLLVWLYAFLGALWFLLPHRNQSSRVSRAGVFVSASGVARLLLAAGARGAQPVLANYVPVIDHWLFLVGLVVFAAGVVLAALDARVLPSTPAPGDLVRVPAAAVPGIRATFIGLCLSLLCFAASWLTLPGGLEPKTRYELGNWAGGHVLQLTSTLAMVSVWLMLVSAITQREIVSREKASLGFAALLLPWAPAPLFALGGPIDIQNREVFTTLMRWAIFPVVAFFLFVCVRALVGAVREGRVTRRELTDPRLTGFVASALLTLIGWGLGASIRGSTTMIPAHYHAAIGAVTVAFMAQSYALFAAAGVPVTGRHSRRFMGLQPALFGIGQSVFAVGFAVAGAHGMGRKLYGQEQQARSTAQLLGLGVMGVGGLLAVVAGVLFLVIVAFAHLRREKKKSIAWVLDAPEPGGTHG